MTMVTKPDTGVIDFIVAATEREHPPSLGLLPDSYRRVDRVWRAYLPEYDPSGDNAENVRRFMGEIDMDSHQCDWTLMRKWTIHNPYVYRYLPEVMRNSEEFIRLIAGHLHDLYVYVPSKVTDTRLAQKLCAVDSDAWQILDATLSTDEDLIIAMLKATDDPEGEGEMIYHRFGMAKDLFHKTTFRQRLVDEEIYADDDGWLTGLAVSA